jgi:alpha-N-acetylglucosaminidase
MYPAILTPLFDLLFQFCRPQLTGPVGMNFTDTIAPNQTSVVADIVKYGTAYKTLLLDLDALVATDSAFLLGPWLEMAKTFGTTGSPVAEDCNGTGYPTITTCAKFYEWNARVQLTSWNPTPKDATAVPDGPIDYASKHWSGLIGDYYAERVDRLMVAFVNNAKSGQGHPDVDVIKARLAYAFTTSTTLYPTEPVGDAVAVSKEMHGKYGHWFGSC